MSRRTKILHDFVISHVLAALEPLSDRFVFYGGTALSRTILNGLRLSEDIDLLATEPRAETARPIDAALSRLQRGLGTVSADLRSVMSEAVTDRLIEANPCTVTSAVGKPSPVHRTEALSMPELRAYYDALDEDHRLPLMLAALRGLRSGEVCALRLKDVNPVTGAITVRQGIYRASPEVDHLRPQDRPRHPDRLRTGEPVA